MTSSDYPTEDSLWQMAKASHAGTSRAGTPGACACPGAIELSAWLDGHADADTADRIELHLATCPDCVQAVLELRELLVAGDARAPQAVIDHAKALVREHAGEPAHTRAARPLPFPQWTFAASRWAAAAVVLVVVGYGGFRAGLQTSSYLSRPATVTRTTPPPSRTNETAALANDGPSGLGQTDTTDQDELIAMVEVEQ